MLRHLGRLSLLNVENSRQGEMVVGFPRPGQRFVGQLFYDFSENNLLFSVE